MEYLRQQKWRATLVVVMVGCLSVLISFPGFPGAAQPGLDLHGIQLSAEEQKALQEQGFIVRPTNYSSFYAFYKEAAANGDPLLVTTDAVLDVTNAVLGHLIIATELQLKPPLQELTNVLVDASRAQWESASSPELKEAALHNWAYFTVAQHLLGDGDKVPAPIKPLVQGEIDLITAHAGPARSPLFGYQEDYRAYDAQASFPSLRGYLQAMTWYERMGLRLNPGDTDDARAHGQQETLRALLITYALEHNPQALAEWRRICKITAILEGGADNLTVDDYLTLMKRVFQPLSSAEELAKADKLQAFIEGARQLKQPRLIPPWLAVDSSALKRWEDHALDFSVFGRRFAPDAYVFQQLAYPNVGTASRPRSLPNGLDLMAAYGSPTAASLLKQSCAFSFRDYDTKLSQLHSALIGGNSLSLPTRWLDVLRSLFAPRRGATALQVLGSDAWQRKALQTALGGWIERGHLFSSPSSPAEADSVTSSAQTYGYVEPYPELYAKLSSLASDLQMELATLGVSFSQPLLKQLADLQKLLNRSENIADQELAGKDLSSNDLNFIQKIGLTLETLSQLPMPVAKALNAQQTGTVPMVTELYPDYRDQMALQAGLGHVFMLLALIQTKDGAQVVHGGTFSYYEFQQPLGKRITEKEWETKVAHGGLPPLWWAEEYVMQPYDIVPFTPVDSGVLSGITRPAQLVVRDEATWKELWQEHASVSFPAPALPQIDFAREMVIAVFAGERFTMGYTVVITQIKQFNDGLQIHYTINVPGPNCFVEQTLSQPFAIVKIPRSDKPVSFIAHCKEKSCQ